MIHQFGAVSRGDEAGWELLVIGYSLLAKTKAKVRGKSSRLSLMNAALYSTLMQLPASVFALGNCLKSQQLKANS